MIPKGHRLTGVLSTQSNHQEAFRGSSNTGPRVNSLIAAIAATAASTSLKPAGPTSSPLRLSVFRPLGSAPDPILRAQFQDCPSRATNQFWFLRHTFSRSGSVIRNEFMPKRSYSRCSSSGRGASCACSTSSCMCPTRPRPQSAPKGRHPGAPSGS